MSGENESEAFKIWFSHAMREIELGDFSDRELTLLGWQAALKSSNHPPDTDITQYFTPESAFANMLRHWNINQICDFYRMLSDRPETQSIPRKPGAEVVPEGVFDVVCEALEVTKLWLSANECDCDMHHVCGRPKVEKIESTLSEFLTRNRATQKETPNAQG